MNTDEIFSILAKAVSEEFEIAIDKFTPDALIKDDLSLDSLDIVDVVVIIDSNFHIKLKSSDFAGLKTFNDLVNFIHNGLNGK